MPGNYIERLRIAIDIENQTQQDRINPTISLGLNNELETHYCVDKKFGTYLFDCTVLTAGVQTVNLHVNELESDSWRIGQLSIRDLRIHGLSVGLKLYQCVYYPVDHPEGFKQMSNVLCLGCRGTWEFSFTAPVHEHKEWRIGLV